MSKISAYTAKTNCDLTDEFLINDVAGGSVNKKVAFDDLTETGTFTPTLGDGTNNYTLSTASGNYTRIGRQVTAYIAITWTSIGSAGATGLQLGGLPYTSASATNFRAGANLAYVEGLDNSAGKQIISDLLLSRTYLIFYLINDNAAPTVLLANTSSSAGLLQLSISYMVD